MLSRTNECRITVPEKAEIVALAAYILIVIIKVFSSAAIYSSEWYVLIKAASYICFAMICISVVLVNSYSIRFLITFIFLLSIGGISAFCSDEISSVVLVMAFICVGSFISHQRLLQCYIVSVTLTVLTILFLYYIGVIEHDILYDGERERLYFGFKYTTYLANYYLHVMLAYFALKRKNITIIETIIILVLNSIIMQATDTRAAFLCTILLVVLCWALRLMPGLFESKVFMFANLLCMPAFAIVSIILPYLYDPGNPKLFSLNKMLSNRLSLGSSAIEQYSFTLFGQKIEWATGRYGIDRFTDYFYVDSSYLNIALNYGIIVLIIILLGFTLLTYSACKNRMYLLCISLIILSLHSATDPQLFELRYDPFLVMIGAVLCGFQVELPTDKQYENYQLIG